MPSYATNILPSNPGLTLGASNQQWSAWLSLLNANTPVNLGVVPLAYTASPAFVATAVISIFTLTLTGNVSGGTYIGIPGLMVFQITQDNVGNRSFTWPTNLLQGTPIGQAANQVTTQLFYYDGMNGWPVGPGVLYP